MNYKEIYRRHFGYDRGEYIPCEVCESPAVDIHHIIFRGQGGKDEIENLIGLCRSCHDKAHFKKEPYLQAEELQEIHNLNL